MFLSGFFKQTCPQCILKKWQTNHTGIQQICHLYYILHLCWQNIYITSIHIHSNNLQVERLNLPRGGLFFQATNDVALHLLLHHYFQEIHGAKPSVLTHRDHTSVGHDVGTNRLARFARRRPGEFLKEVIMKLYDHTVPPRYRNSNRYVGSFTNMTAHFQAKT